MQNHKTDVRLAAIEDLQSIETLMKHSMTILGKGHYSEQQIQSCCKYVCVPELQLILDQTFFVAIDSNASIVGCGGWSFRKTLYAGPSTSSQAEAVLNPQTDPARIRAMFIAPDSSGKGIGSLILSASEKAAKNHGFQHGVLGATLSGLQFYKSKGWTSIAQERATLPDGVAIDVVKMKKILSKG